MTLAPAPTPVRVERRILLNNVSWDEYQDLLKAVGERRLRHTYDRGSLEIMTVSDPHERVKKLIARLIEAYGDAEGIDIEGLGSTTFGRKKLRRGLEPDECYYIAHAADVIGKPKLDLLADPPPDLVIEIDLSPPDLARVPVYAALGVSEIWRYDGRQVASLHRTSAGTYREATSSLAFPHLPMDELNRFLATGLKSGQPEAVRALRQWLRGRRRTRRGKK